MKKSRRRKRKKLSSSSSFEGLSTIHHGEVEASDSEKSVTMASDLRGNERPSLAEIWKVLTEIKTNTKKLMLEVESLNGNYKEIKGNLQNTKG